jgi:hypothetical protein
LANWLKRNEAPIAAAIITICAFGGWFVMPRLMLAISGGGPVVGTLVAILFMLALFAVLWLRARHQHRINGD